MEHEASGVLTKEERMAARRARLVARRSKRDPKYAGGAEGDGAAEAKLSPSEDQLLKSRNLVDSAKTKAVDRVTDIPYEAEDVEGTRRLAEEERRRARNDRIERELRESAEANQEIKEKWDQIALKNIPQELYEFISEQQMECRRLIARKDALVTALSQEIKEKDDAYDELLTTQANNISELVKRMREEFVALMTCYSTELQRVEEAFLTERAQTLQSNKGEITTLFERRREMELKILESKQAREEEFQGELSRIRARDTEEYNNLKATLENNIQLLEQQLEEMRATYQLNTEKLDYNHRVLREMDAENKRTVKHQKQKIKRLKEALNASATKYAQQDGTFKAENAALTEDYKRMTEQFKDLQRKYRHFEKVDTEKYQEVWDMNAEAVNAITGKVLQADRIIYSQVLGLEWQKPELPSSTLQNRGEAARDPTTAGNKQPSGADSLRFSPEQVRAALAVVAQEAAFLLDKKLQEKLSALDEEERRLYTIDSILATLGIVDNEDLEELISLFYESPSSTTLSVHTNDVVRVLRDYMMDKQQHKKTAALAPLLGHESGAKEKKIRKRQQEREFWVRAAEIIDEKKAGVWNAVEKSLTSYASLLERRSEGLQQVQQLGEQNEKLRALLQQYLDSEAPRALQIPPTRIIRLDG